MLAFSLFFCEGGGWGCTAGGKLLLGLSMGGGCRKQGPTLQRRGLVGDWGRQSTPRTPGSGHHCGAAALPRAPLTPVSGCPPRGPIGRGAV